MSAQDGSSDAVPLDADIVLMGELHDIPEHHANQAEWVARMEPAAIVFEMLPERLEDTAEKHRLGFAAILGNRLEWAQRGWPDFEMYDPIFKASGDARIFGAEVPSDVILDAMANGAAAVMGDEAPRFGLDLDLPLEERDLRESMQDDAHCNEMPPEMLPGMVEAQRLRDAYLARAALKALDETGGPVAIITGNGHARGDWGVPVHLGFAAPDVGVLSIAQTTVEQRGAPFDAVVMTADRPGRGDPCDAFR